MIEISGCARCADCGGISNSSPAAEVKRTASESPYTTAVTRPLRDDVIASRLTKFFPIIICLRACFGHGDGLTDQVCRCPRAIAVAVERLLLTHAPPPIARGFAGQLSECRSEGSLRGVAKRRCDRDHRIVGVAQHLHGLLEPVLAQPGMRREPGALLEGATEVKARQAGIRSQRRKGDVRIVVRAQALDRAAQRDWRKATQRRLKDGSRAGMCSQQACGEKIIELMPEQRIQRRAALNRVRCAYEQTGC